MKSVEEINNDPILLIGSRTWPEDIPPKNNLTKVEKELLSTFKRNISSGWLAIGLDPVGLSNEQTKMGILITETSGILSFSINTVVKYDDFKDSAKEYNKMVEMKITELLCDSPMLSKVIDGKKVLKYPYKHISILDSDMENNDIYSIKLFKDMNRIRSLLCDCNEDFPISYSEALCVMDRLAPEYTVVKKEKIEEISQNNIGLENGDISKSNTGNEHQIFLLDKFQTKFVNEMHMGHRVLLANAGAGKSVLLLAKAYKYASAHKDERVLVTCFNNNLADMYKFKNSCANYGNNKNVYIMTFHHLVKKIYSEFLHQNIDNITDDDIKNLLIYAKKGLNLSFGAIFIDEIQIFEPLWIDICFSLLSKKYYNMFFMTGDLNQTVRQQSRKGDVPWKKINEGKLNFAGRVMYMSNNYRNSAQISKYLEGMLKYMNKNLARYGIINDSEYDYNVFCKGPFKDILLRVERALSKDNICKKTVEAIKNMRKECGISYSDMAVIFPFKEYKTLRYNFIDDLTSILNQQGIPYSIIFSDTNKIHYSNTSGVILTTVDSSLGLDFKAVIMTGLYPLEFIYSEGKSTKLTRWDQIRNLSPFEREVVKLQFRKIYTGCSRAREALYVLSDLEQNCPFDDILEIR